jgi:hypothetical protein
MSFSPRWPFFPFLLFKLGQISSLFLKLMGTFLSEIFILEIKMTERQ